MIIYNIDFSCFSQNLEINKENKKNLGEIHTSFEFINKMLDVLPPDSFTNPGLKWLDPGAGRGFFSMCIYRRLMAGLEPLILDRYERHCHVIKKMIFMIDINPDNVNAIKKMFGDDCNVREGDFLLETYRDFDIVVGNPPFNLNGTVKVPTNTSVSKKKDGESVWHRFIIHSIGCIRPGGLILFIVPSLWMKPDKKKMFEYITQYKLHKIHCFSNTQMNKIFRGHAQTPSCYFLLEKKNTDKKTLLYDNGLEKYIEYPLTYKAIPVFGSSIIKKLLPYVNTYGGTPVYKTSVPSKSISFSETKTNYYSFKNIKTCLLDGNKPRHIINYSNKPAPYYGIRKIIMAHGMYGLPYLDDDGVFGISKRDKYVICGFSSEQMKKMTDLFSTKFALYVFESFKYRMKFLEKYAFEAIPDITKIPDFPEIINDDTIADFFGLSFKDIHNINTLHKKKYLFFSN